MLSVIELAQLLTGALDERFNIIKKGEVVQVVSCLEAFNITHESYREVQNTRIIKDLQALRQNKANDQILAKRIKNLLRKWKERLAATVPATVHPSQPNSPQNMSQGSSDTQFMTQQSQSPPIIHHRPVNGPTSFSNLLPKQQQHPQNHHHLIQLPLTSPLPLVVHQNGSQESSQSQSLLGKRKLDGDMDENSNHSRKKMMKKSTTSSPLITHNHLPTPPVPAQQQQHHHQQQQLHLTPVAADPAPKKRGRKKGSKGIDSMLNGKVPDFEADINQKIALSTGKRNKTTMELQQMLESHQNTTTSMSWINGDVDSSSVDRGFVSHDASRDGFGVTRIKQEVRVKDEPNPDPSPSTSHHQQQLALRSLTIEDEIARLREQLPPIDYEAAAHDTFDEYNTIDEYGETVACTCTFKEVITYAGENEVETSEAAEGQANAVQPIISVKNGESGKPPPVAPANDDSDDDDDETDDFCAVEDEEDEKTPPRSRDVVKSIFDPEYDANENLIEEMVRRKPRDNASKVIEIKVDKAAVKASRIEPLMLQPELPLTQQVERVPIINYECVEDPMCPARAFFQRDPVTMDEVEKLHNSNINGVNGFWSGIIEEKPVHDYSKDTENIDYAKHQLWKRVVPRYNFLTLDKIPKTFDDDSPFSMPPPPPPPSTSSSLAPSTNGNDGNGDDKKSLDDNVKTSDIDFREWHEIMNVRSYNDEVLTILPYVIID